MGEPDEPALGGGFDLAAGSLAADVDAVPVLVLEPLAVPELGFFSNKRLTTRAMDSLARGHGAVTYDSPWRDFNST